MKKYIRCTYDNDVKELTQGLAYIQIPTWDGLVEAIETETDFSVSSEYINNPQRYIFLYDPDGNEYEAEVTRYYEGDYELRFENVHATGWNDRQRNTLSNSRQSATTSFEASTEIEASELFEGSNKDVLLPLEHQVDLAIDEAWALHRSQRSIEPVISNRAADYANDLEEIKKAIRALRHYLSMYDAGYYEDTEETMLEDSSRYLED